MTTSPQALAGQLLGILDKDAERLSIIDRYSRGDHDDPYIPDLADDEYRLLARRSVSNWLPLLIGTPAQALYVDSYRPSRKPAETNAEPSEPSASWKHWQYSRLDARQAAVYRGALTFGHSFTVTERDAKGKVTTKGLSALRTAALYEDAANDDDAYAALTVTKKPHGEKGRGQARLWDAKRVYKLTYLSLTDPTTIRVDAGKLHGNAECPVTRFAAAVDLDGRTSGVVEPMIPLQDRINQTIFDLLVAQTYGSFKVRWATGMAPPIIRDEEGEAVLDVDGQPQPLPINLNAKRFLFGEDDTVNFGTLDETPLGGYIESIDMSIRHLGAISQTPPHYLLGQIANLSAEALTAAETALARKVEEFKHVFGEAWERVFRLAAQLDGNTADAEDFEGEVYWRDMEGRSLAQTADGLGKLAESLGIPKRGLWRRVPQITQGEIDEWGDMLEQDRPEVAMSGALRRAGAANQPAPVAPVVAAPEQPPAA
ncbi:phage portal protein [Rhodococcus antarcticus]|uniref:Phage portal protein n=1 Tax=Rhodococcus antarcticus TaxID=2987751 RepID=A0ABY6NWD3_9NOCA|nr:phage portal protein [Rhodococcus antarcticus]UZJ23707.1 phage portal protein [Rhodococcus antarcticus]